MRVLVYDDRPQGEAERVASTLRERLPSADVVVQTRREVSLLEEPPVDVLVLPLDELEPPPRTDALAQLTLQHPEALVLVLTDDHPRPDLLQLALARDVRGFVADRSPATLAALVSLVAAERDRHPEVEPSRKRSRGARSRPDAAGG